MLISFPLLGRTHLPPLLAPVRAPCPVAAPAATARARPAARHFAPAALRLASVRVWLTRPTAYRGRHAFGRGGYCLE